LPRFEDHHCSDSIVVAPYPTSQQVQSSVSWSFEGTSNVCVCLEFLWLRCHQIVV
jgi:hypothetical protein